MINIHPVIKETSESVYINSDKLLQIKIIKSNLLIKTDDEISTIKLKFIKVTKRKGYIVISPKRLNFTKNLSEEIDVINMQTPNEKFTLHSAGSDYSREYHVGWNYISVGGNK